jgi:hypothetical protein
MEEKKQTPTLILLRSKESHQRKTVKLSLLLKYVSTLPTTFFPMETIFKIPSILSSPSSSRSKALSNL